MINLTRYDKDGVELVIDNTTGEAFATQAGYARMSGVSYEAIKKRFERLKGGDNFTLKTAELPTLKGLQVVTLLPAEIIFKWLFKDNPELAFEMGKVGATVYLHTLAGFKVSSEAIAKPLELPPPAVQVANLVNALDRLGIALDNPRYAQALQDIALNTLGVNPSQALAPVREYWVGVAERSEQLGYPVGLVAAKRSQLGKFVKASGCVPRQEFRLVNGPQRSVNVYQVTPELDSVIHEYWQGN